RGDATRERYRLRCGGCGQANAGAASGAVGDALDLAGFPRLGGPRLRVRLIASRPTPHGARLSELGEPGCRQPYPRQGSHGHPDPGSGRPADSHHLSEVRVSRPEEIDADDVLGVVGREDRLVELKVALLRIREFRPIQQAIDIPANLGEGARYRGLRM